MKIRPHFTQSWKPHAGMEELTRVTVFNLELSIYGVNLFQIRLMNFLPHCRAFDVQLLGIGIGLYFDNREFDD